MTTNHAQFDELVRFLNDTLDEQRSVEISEHLDSCQQCCREVENIISKESPLLDSASQTSDETLSSRLMNGANKAGIPSRSSFDLRFVICEEIAQGGMGIVYRGFDRELKREIAIKVTKENEVGLTARFFREAQISGQLQHPGVVPIYEMGHLSDGRMFMAMRLVRGQTFLQLLSESSEESTVGAKLEIFGQICQTMAFAHSKDFIHRDLKPENVMVGSFGEVQIMDWGLAKKLSRVCETGAETVSVPEPAEQAIVDPSQTIAGQLMGTPAYMAPEQAKGELATKRTDVFALGGILFQILTGRAPFDESTKTKAIAKSAGASFTDVYTALDQSGADQSLVDIVKECLDPKPLQRPADAEAVNQQFSQYIENRERERQDARLAEGQYKERLIAQQKRSRQLTWFSMAMAVMVIGLAVAGYMYMAEKNARVAKQNEIQKGLLETKVRSELYLRQAIDKASQYQFGADKAAQEQQAAQWSLALKEIEKGVPFLSDSVDAELRTEFNELAKTIRERAALEISLKNGFDLEKKCRVDILACCEECLYPADLKKCRTANLPASLAAAFGDLGVLPGADIVPLANRLANSAFKTDFLLGLMMWRREIMLEQKRHLVDQRRPKENLESDYQWIGDLIELVDPNEFRASIRKLHSENKFEELAEVLAQPEAVESLDTIHLAANILGSVHPDQKSRIGYLRRARQKFPEDFFTNWYLVSRVKESETRIKFIKPCFALRPNNAGVLVAVGTLSLMEKEYDRAVERLEKLVVMESEYTPAWVNLGVAYGKTGEETKALECFETALNSEGPMKNPAHVFHLRGNFHRDRESFDLAVADYLAWTEYEPQDPTAHDFLAAVYNQQGKFRQAIDVQRNASQLRADYKWYHRRLGEYYINYITALKREQRLEDAEEAEFEAIREFTKIASLVPKDASPHEELAKVCEQLTSYPQAIASLRQAILLRPDYDNHKNKMSNLCHDMCRDLEDDGELEQCVDALNDTIDFLDDYDPKHKRVFRLVNILAGLTRKLGRFEDSIAATLRAIELVPKNRILREGLGHLYVYNKQLDLAEETFLDLQNRFDDDPRAVASLANLYLVKGDLPKAESVILSAFENGIDSPEIQMMYGRTLMALGEEQGLPEKVKQGQQILEQHKETAPHVLPETSRATKANH